MSVCVCVSDTYLHVCFSQAHFVEMKMLQNHTHTCTQLFQTKLNNQCDGNLHKDTFNQRAKSRVELRSVLL